MDAVSRSQRTIDVLELVLADAHYGLPLDRIVEVVPRVTITRLPELALPVLGFIVHRGTAVVAVDMRHRLGIRHGGPRSRITSSSPGPAHVRTRRAPVR